MAEKRGGLEKMRYDFPTEAVLEVQIKSKWYRVTSREFRSFDGKRRYTKPVKQPSQGMRDLNELKWETIDYTGPLYMFASNEEVIPVYNEKIVATPYYEETNKISGSR